MPNFSVGYLFKKKYIEFESKKWEVFEFLDYVTAITFTNKSHQQVCDIVSGVYTGEYAEILNKNGEESKLVFIADSITNAIRDNNNSVDFAQIRKNKINITSKYYLRSNSDNGLIVLDNKSLKEFLEKQSKSGFDEEVFEKNTDISTMYSSIKKTIISQDEPTMKILTSLFKNQKIVESDLDIDLIAKLKENILICGSTGTGKTEILKRISKIYKIPIIIADSTTLSETGYHGRNISDMLEDLCLAANGDIKLAERGIIVLDEFDKLAEKPSDNQSHVSRIGVQRSLLKLLDGSEFYFNNKKFDTSRLTIVAIGAFTGIINGDDYSNLTNEDFIRYGIIRELIGRFSKVIPMNTLGKEDIIKILKESDFSPINTYKKLFEILGVKYDFNDEFIEYIADLAIKQNSGARSLKTVFDECISSALFRIFAGEYSEISLIKPNDDNEKPYVLKKTK